MAKRATKQQQPQPPRGLSWSVYHIKSTPAKLVGIVDNAPDEQTAIARAIEGNNALAVALSCRECWPWQTAALWLSCGQNFSPACLPGFFSTDPNRCAGRWSTREYEVPPNERGRLIAKRRAA